MDRDPDGKAAGDRNFGLTDEGRQRAKELSAVVQCDLRVAAARAEVAKKAVEEEAEAVHVRQILATRRFGGCAGRAGRDSGGGQVRGET